MVRIAKVSTKFKVDSFSKVVERAMLKIGKAVEAARPAIVTKVRGVVEEGIRETAVFQGIVGDSPSSDAGDLQAHFGLTDQMARGAGEIIVREVTKQIDILVTIRRPRKGYVTVEAKTIGFEPENYEKGLIANREPLGYRSITETKNGATRNGQWIPWMDWVMSGGRTLIESTNPGISKYFVDFEDLSGGSSRSGRALMRRIKPRGKPALEGSFPYTLPTVLITRNPNAKNFIDDLFRMSWFRGAVKFAVLQVLRSYRGGIPTGTAT